VHSHLYRPRFGDSHRPARVGGCSRLRPPARWGFAMYLASKDGYEDAVLPTGAFAGMPEDALDCRRPLPR